MFVKVVNKENCLQQESNKQPLTMRVGTLPQYQVSPSTVFKACFFFLLLSYTVVSNTKNFLLTGNSLNKLVF